jgi:FMN phosphatase YigB (HAD superfamily)
MGSLILLVDFDDTLFDTKAFKHDVFALAEGLGYSKDRVSCAYARSRKRLFTLKKFSGNLCNNAKEVVKFERAALNLLTTRQYVKPGALRFVKAISRRCVVYICTYGDRYFQRQKIGRSGIMKYVAGVYVTSDPTKYDIYTKIFKRHAGRRAVLIDNDITVCRHATKFGIKSVHVTTSSNYLSLIEAIRTYES